MTRTYFMARNYFMTKERCVAGKWTVRSGGLPDAGRPALLVLVLCILFHLIGASNVHAQDAIVRGFVTDAANGQPLELVNVVLIEENGVLRGAVTDRDGLFLLRSVDPGRYTLRVSALGYRTHEEDLDLAPEDVRTLELALTQTDLQLDEVVVESDRTSGAARTTAGHQIIRPRDLELIPSPDVSGDLSGYLSAQPGIVTSGDRGGQMFIRGGEPTQNLIFLDGIPLVQPFHVFGSYSAFPAKIIQRADVYAAGFGARFAGRLSAVIDVASRPGNSRRFAGSIGVSPFVSSVFVEGPIIPGRVSILMSARESMLELAGETFAQEELPYKFGDAFARVHAVISRSSRLSISAVRTHDRGRLVESEIGGLPPEDVRWVNEGVGMRYLGMPSIIPVVVDLQIAHSRFTTELGRFDDPLRRSDVRNTRIALEAGFEGERVDVTAGWQLDVLNLQNELGGLFQEEFVETAPLSPSGFFVESDILVRPGLQFRPGLRLQFYGVRFDPFVEPRLQIRWEKGRHHFSGAVGLYQQEVVGLNDRRDAASVFTIWTRIPRDGEGEGFRAGRLGRSLHGVLGYRTSPTPWLDWSIEGFYKHVSNLFIAEWTPYPRFTSQLQPANGRSFGVETRLEVRRGVITAFVNYGLSASRYEARQPSLEVWYGTESLSFRPPHDRRHQVNLVASAELGPWEVGARWEFGSGLPFSRAIGFDGFALVDDIVDIAEIPRSRRVVYEEPFRGVLPAYHRLDVSVQRTFDLGPARLRIQAAVLNAYDRRNVFYLDVFTLNRVDQLPVVPTLGLELAFE